jgi:hypothetical protein
MNATLMYNIMQQPSPTPGIICVSPSTNSSMFQLNINDHIASLERKIMTLRNHKFDSVEMPKRSRDTNNHPQQHCDNTARASPPTNPAPVTQPSDLDNTTNPVVAPEPKNAPIHLFMKACEPSYLPPHERNLAGPPLKQTKEREYQVQAPIENPQIASDVYLQWMRTPNVTLTSEELLSLSPDVQNKVHESITTKRMPVPHHEVKFTTCDDDPLPFPSTDDKLIPMNLAEPIIIPNPYKMYLNTLAPGQRPKVLTVAR